MRQAFACHMACFLSVGAVLRSIAPAHWGPQAPPKAAPPLAREFEARVAVADKACGLSGKL